MGKSRGRGKSEVENLRGEIRQLKKQVKYFKRRSHIENAILDDVIDDSDLQITNTVQCQECGKGLIIDYDFVYATLRKCNHCDFEEKKRKGKKED